MSEVIMQFPERSKKFEWNFNTIVTVIGIVSGLVVTSVGWGITYANMRNDSAELRKDNADLRKQIADLLVRMDKDGADKNARLSDVQQQLAQISPLTFQITRATEAGAENKKAIEMTNNRIDHVVEAIGGKMDTVIDSVNKVSTQVQVLNSKLEDIQGKPDKSMFRMPVVKP